MILDEYIEITISNQGRYYAALGYPSKQGTKLIIPIEHLLSNSNAKVKCKCDECKREWKATYQSVVRQGKFHRCFECTRKYVGKIADHTNTVEASRKRVGHLHQRWNPNKKEFQSYAYQVRRLTEQVYDEHKDIINPNDLPRSLCGTEGGYQLDHIISIKEGYEKGISPDEISKIENLQMLPWHINRAKAA
jgi:hypothetical protein